jgi:hypothetical protein
VTQGVLGCLTRQKGLGSAFFSWRSSRGGVGRDEVWQGGFVMLGAALSGRMGVVRLNRLRAAMVGFSMPWTCEGTRY